MEDALDPSSYEKVTARRLTKSRVLWVNFALLREMGIEVPPEGMTPAFEKKLLDALGYAIPQTSDDPTLFGSETKDFYADRYGGLGMNGNLGSGRAASAGQVQIKGIGRTPMVGRKVEDFGHAHGGASASEGVQEGDLGRDSHIARLPNGANRVLALLIDGNLHRSRRLEGAAIAVVVRADPLRPAAFSE